MQGAGRHPGEVRVGGRPELTLDVRLQLPGEPRLQRGLAENDRQRPDPHPWRNGRVHAAACGWGRLSDTRPALSHSQEPHWWRLCCQRLAQCGQEAPELGDHGVWVCRLPAGRGRACSSSASRPLPMLRTTQTASAHSLERAPASPGPGLLPLITVSGEDTEIEGRQKTRLDHRGKHRRRQHSSRNGIRAGALPTSLSISVILRLTGQGQSPSE